MNDAPGAKRWLPDRERLEELIPHRFRMCLLDRVVDWDDAGIRCEAVSHREPDNPLRTASGLLSVAGIEYAAQAMALHGGLLADRDGTSASPGYLASARAVELHRMRLDDLDGPLVVTAQREAGDERQILYSFRLAHGDAVVVEGRAAVVLDALPVAPGVGAARR
ncbi:MAG TPA: hydroxymyristoyl-ACP dehydratase [Burkholderiaceae bacterium]|nr:hydroxymyristoyl-ACP dehydratase [Burkholderiaceae bacterium]